MGLKKFEDFIIIGNNADSDPESDTDSNKSLSNSNSIQDLSYIITTTTPSNITTIINNSALDNGVIISGIEQNNIGNKIIDKNDIIINDSNERPKILSHKAQAIEIINQEIHKNDVMHISQVPNDVKIHELPEPILEDKSLALVLEKSILSNTVKKCLLLAVGTSVLIALYYFKNSN
jgi:hypothetical protein